MTGTEESRKRAIFAGSFDPFTRGHADIVRRALEIFDQVVVAVLAHSSKEPLFTVSEREDLIRGEFADDRDRVAVKSFSGLLVDFAKHEDARVLVRGLRAISDYDYEAQMALMNKSLWEEVETVFFFARAENSYISSTMVKQVASLGGDVGRYVSPPVARALVEKVAN